MRNATLWLSLLPLALLAGGSARAETSREACDLLADPAERARMTSGREFKLMTLCREPVPPLTNGDLTGLEEAVPPPEAFAVEPTPAPTFLTAGGVDVLVNDPASDVGGSTQSETSLAVTGDTICAAWNDRGGSLGFTGFGRSQDGGATFTDRGDFPLGLSGSTFADPSLAYSVRDGAFYYSAIVITGLGFWSSSNDCSSFTSRLPPATTGGDKEILAVDNEPTSPFYGRIYLAWTQGSSPPVSKVSRSANSGVSWSTATLVGPAESLGTWPAVAPNGDVYVALLDRSLTIGGLEDQVIFRSHDGGASWTRMTDIASDRLRPEHVASSMLCGRAALNGNIRNLALPQIAIHPDATTPAGYVIHAVYPYDADGAGPDASDVFYRRSVDGAQTWSTELRLSDDATATDQWYPALGVNADGVVAVSWYDRRLDPVDNLLFDRFAVLSYDGGLSWGANLRISDVSSPVSVNLPHFDGYAACYHGDYDQVAVDASTAHFIWSDDRRVTASGPNPDVYYDRVALPEPSAPWLIGSGLALLALLRRR